MNPVLGSVRVLGGIVTGTIQRVVARPGGLVCQLLLDTTCPPAFALPIALPVFFRRRWFLLVRLLSRCPPSALLLARGALTTLLRERGTLAVLLLPRSCQPFDLLLASGTPAVLLLPRSCRPFALLLPRCIPAVVLLPFPIPVRVSLAWLLKKLFLFHSQHRLSSTCRGGGVEPVQKVVHRIFPGLPRWQLLLSRQSWLSLDQTGVGGGAEVKQAVRVHNVTLSQRVVSCGVALRQWQLFFADSIDFPLCGILLCSF